MGPANTIWSPQNGEGEYNQGSVVDLVDNSGNFLVDASGNFLVDQGVTFTPIAQTTWEEDATG